MVPRGHPGGPFWHFGPALEDHGSSRMVARWSGTGFSSILECFWDIISRAFRTPRLEISIFVRVCFQVTFLSISESKFRCLGLQIQGFRMEGIAKIDFSQKSCFMDFGHEFGCFVEVLGAVFLVFCASKASSSSSCFQGWQPRVPSLRQHGQGRGHSQSPGVTESIL